MEDLNPFVNDKRRWLDNLRLALEKWKSVPDSRIVPNLQQWYCGTQACFGGHLMLWREFQEMGVYPKSNGEPMMATPSEKILEPHNVSYCLFGSVDMFYPKPSYMIYSDHQCIVDRLERQIHRLEQLIRDKS